MTTSLILHTILALLLLILPFGALYLLDRPTIRSFAIALVRGIVQLLVFSLIVWGVYKIDNTWINIIWFVAMTIWGGFMVVSKCHLAIKDYLLPASAGLFGGTIAVGLWLLVAVLPIESITARWFIPVMAVLLGHSAAMLVRGLSSFATMFQRNRAQYDFLLGNGASPWRALMPFFQDQSFGDIITYHRKPISIGTCNTSPVFLRHAYWWFLPNQCLCSDAIYHHRMHHIISIIVRYCLVFS